MSAIGRLMAPKWINPILTRQSHNIHMGISYVKLHKFFLPTEIEFKFIGNTAKFHNKRSINMDKWDYYQIKVPRRFSSSTTSSFRFRNENIKRHSELQCRIDVVEMPMGLSLRKARKIKKYGKCICTFDVLWYKIDRMCVLQCNWIELN